MVFPFLPHFQKNEPNHCPSTFLIRFKNGETVIWFFFLDRAKMEIAFEIFPPLTRTEECWKIKFNKKKERIKKNQKENKPKKH